MKKIILLLCVGMFAICALSCKKCITCTESNTGYATDYCGLTPDVNNFESDLKTQGTAAGENWTCVNK